MKVLSMPRRCGKTFQSIVESGRSQAIIVCATESEANRVMREAEIMGVKIPTPLSCAFARERLMGMHSGVIVDNLDWVLQSFLGSSVHAVTIDGPPAEINWSEAAATGERTGSGIAQPTTQGTKSAPEIVEYNSPCFYCVKLSKDGTGCTVPNCIEHDEFEGRRLSPVA